MLWKVFISDFFFFFPLKQKAQVASHVSKKHPVIVVSDSVIHIVDETSFHLSHPPLRIPFNSWSDTGIAVKRFDSKTQFSTQ